MKSWSKNFFFIILLTISLLIAIYFSPAKGYIWHDLYNNLLFLPIILAAFAFGARGSVLIAISISLIYFPLVFKYKIVQDMPVFDILFDIILYITFGTIVGVLVDMEQERRKELGKIQGELASILSKTMPPKKEKPLGKIADLKYHYGTMIGEDEAMQKVYQLIDKIGPSTTSVLILGESGTGKELVAKALHDQSKRKDMPLVTINCAAIPDTLLESELFGHKKGSFTGALEDKKGKFEVADGGTIFLDEIGTMKAELQAKLLRVLQEKEIQIIGSTELKKVDVRIITATNVDIEEKVRLQEFREDLYYRLNVVSIELPPLRKRRSDIPLLIEHFCRKYCDQPFQLTKETMKVLENHEWLGNIRELENVVQRASVLRSGEIFLPEHLPKQIKSNEVKIGAAEIALPEEGIDLDELEKGLIVKALKKTAGNKTKAAELLGLTRYTLLYRLDKYGLK
ncbi:sigma-54 interaction domain-containing protein [Candidatus Margulisiibacteriota bacterium]